MYIISIFLYFISAGYNKSKIQELKVTRVRKLPVEVETGDKRDADCHDEEEEADDDDQRRLVHCK